MNVNEVIANRALEILGHRKGDYEYISPNDHVNLAQSTNDTFPTASHLAIITDADRLISELDRLSAALARKGDEFAFLPKTGRTHLMDALPVTLGDEFHAYAAAIRRAGGRSGRGGTTSSRLQSGVPRPAPAREPIRSSGLP